MASASTSANPATSLLRGQLALVTGASAGIGHATAERLASLGVNLLITGRRADRLHELGAELHSKHSVRVEPLIFDIASRTETEAVFAKPEVVARLAELTILVNNAGLARGTETMPQASIDDWEAMIDTNIKGLLYVTRLCLPHFVKQNRGHIVNIGSVAGRWVYPGGGVYCATKFAVRALSEGLRFDLLGKAIRVTNIEPGMVETEFSRVRFDGDEAKAQAVYKGMTPLQARDIAETVSWCLERPPHVNIQELVVYPTDQASVGNPYVHRRST